MKRRSSPRRTTSGSAGLPDPAEWFSTQPPAGSGGKKCWICTHAEAREWVGRVAKMNETALRPVAAKAIHATLVERLSYPYTVGTVMHHLREHLARA